MFRNALLTGLVVALAGCGVPDRAPTGGVSDLTPPVYDRAFHDYWGGGGAEISGYDLAYPRYGTPRAGTAVTIFVTEPFRGDDHVKHEDQTKGESQVFPTLKLNLVQDFPTGVYDYNMMTSTFLALDGGPRGGGLPSKVSFSSQEWCGQVYAQSRFMADGVRLDSHSYFDGEIDQTLRLEWPRNGTSEDALFLWARGLAAPVVDAGQSVEVSLLRSLEIVRLQHVQPDWDVATLARRDQNVKISVPAGEFEVRVLTATVAPTMAIKSYPPGAGEVELPRRTWIFYVEEAAPHRLIRWTRSDGLAADLLGTSRLEYWRMNADGFEEALSEFGLTPRPRRTP